MTIEKHQDEPLPLSDELVRQLAVLDEAIHADMPKTAGGNSASVTLPPELNRLQRLIRSLDELGRRSSGLSTSGCAPCEETGELVAPSPAGTQTPKAAGRSVLRLPSRLGRFQIRRELGFGGFGIVLLAYDSQLRREVALKVPRFGSLLSPAQRRRFQREAYSAAGLNHPNIVPVYESMEDGPFLYIASAYCPGPTLAQWLKDRSTPVPFDVAARLIIDLANAVEHAHQRGILHRDLKPSNIMLHDGVPKITDFGLAKLLDEQQDETMSGVLLGTARYMAPEQAAGQSSGIAATADIYALGVILYELLTGRTPFIGESPIEIVQLMSQSDPIPPGRIRSRVPRDLELICLKCLEKSPGKRYASAAALARDLGHFLAGEPIQARPASSWERVAKWCYRHPARAVLTAAAVSLAMCAGIIAFLRDQAATERANAAVEREAAAVQMTKQQSEARERLEWQLYRQRIASAEREFAANNMRRATELLDLCPSELRGWEWRCLQQLCHADPRIIMSHDGKDVIDLAFHPNGQQFATAGADRTVRIWDVETGRELKTLRGHREGVRRVSYSPDHQWIVSTTPGGEIIVWAESTGELRHRWETNTSTVWDLAFVPDGSRFATIAGEGITYWDPVLGEQRGGLDGSKESRYCLAFSPNGQWLATGFGRSQIALWDLAKTKRNEIRPPLSFGISKVVFSPDSRLLLATGGDFQRGSSGQTHIWDVATGEFLRALAGQTDPVWDAAFSSDGQRVATAGEDGTIKLWDRGHFDEMLSLRGRAGNVRCLAFSPDPSSRWLAATSEGGAIRLWDSADWKQSKSPWESNSFTGHEGLVFCAVASPDGQRIASISDDQTVRIWDAASGRETGRFPAGGDRGFSLAWHPSGERILWSAWPGELRSVELASGSDSAPSVSRHPPFHIHGLAYSPDGHRIAAACHDHRIHIWDGTDLAQHRALLAHSEPVTSVAFSPDGQSMVSTSFDGTIAIHDLATNQLVGRSPSQSGRTLSAVFSPDGSRIVSGGTKGVVQIWDAKTLSIVRELREHTAPIWSVAWSSDGRLIASASDDWTVRLWDATEFRQIRSYRGHSDRVHSVVFGSDGRTLISASFDQLVKIWSVTPVGE